MGYDRQKQPDATESHNSAVAFARAFAFHGPLDANGLGRLLDSIDERDDQSIGPVAYCQHRDEFAADDSGHHHLGALQCVSAA